MTKEEKLDMFSMRLDGYSLQEIGDKYGVTRERVRQIFEAASKCSTSSTRRCIYPNIAKWMTDNGYSQKDIAKMAGYSQSHISSILTGRTRPSFGFIKAITVASGMTFEVAFQTEEAEKGEEHAE